jgi:phosphoribosylglycinamide formyltransferase-1|tara:strand:- start:15200 stop:15790 length:591 start_codon:yes stop_codon:yes gene_type:complete
MRIVILGTGNGSNAEVILKSSSEGQLGDTEVVGVFSDVEDSNILTHSKNYNVLGKFLDPGNKISTITHEQEDNWIREIKASNPDLVVLAGFMRIISKRFLKEFDFKVINLHPSLLPSFPGLNSIEKAFNKKVKITGCTVHWVNEEVDGGEIIAQAPVRIMDGDNLELVKQKIHAAEHMLLPWVIRDLANGTIAFGK